jgi:MOSC domain-containing protein YiiM
LGFGGATDEMDRPWFSAFFKEPVEGPVRLSEAGLTGDGQADRENHGLPEMAALCYSAGHYDRWRAELNRPDFCFGGFGENFTFDGADEHGVCVGDVYELGGATVRVTQPRQPCWKLGRRWRIKELPSLVVANGRCGWYVKVLAEGVVDAGDHLVLSDRPHPEWTIARVNDQFYRGKDDLGAAGKLAALEALSPTWRSYFARRADAAGRQNAGTGAEPDR